jgi:restriction system protein
MNKKKPQNLALAVVNFGIQMLAQMVTPPKKDVAKMNGKQFEQHVFEIFQTAKWHPQQTPQSGDSGADVLATSPKGIRYAIECKNWKKTIGNEVVRSINSGKQIYKCNKVVIVSARSEFTEPARKQAKILGVTLLRLDQLEFWIKSQS